MRFYDLTEQDNGVLVKVRVLAEDKHLIPQEGKLCPNLTEALQSSVADLLRDEKYINVDVSPILQRIHVYMEDEGEYILSGEDLLDGDMEEKVEDHRRALIKERAAALAEEIKAGLARAKANAEQSPDEPAKGSQEDPGSISDVKGDSV